MGSRELMVAIADDLALFGPPAAVSQAFDNFCGDLADTGLVVRLPKCGVLWPHSASVPELVSVAADKRSIPLHIGCMGALGAPVGLDNAKIDDWLTTSLQHHKRLFELLLNDLLPAQISMLLLRLSAIPMMGYLARVVRPSLLLRHAISFDESVLQVALKRIGCSSLFLLWQIY